MLGAESSDFSHAEKERTGWKAEQIHKMTTSLIQNDNNGPFLAVMLLAGGQGGSLLNPITTRGANYAHYITDSPPGFENPAASLI